MAPSRALTLWIGSEPGHADDRVHVEQAGQPDGVAEDAVLLGAGGDISIVGYDDSRVAQLSFIDLTSVRQAAADVAELAIQAASERLDDGRTSDRDIVLAPTLVVRGSTGPAGPVRPT
jgi:Periplasmic binding protein-like domain